MSDFMRADGRRLFAVAEEHAELLGVAGDGRCGRLDRTARTGSPSPSCRRSSRSQHGRDLAPPKTWDEFLQVAKFFQGRQIDGKKVYGAYIFTERGSEGITMG
jgi:hypothetical protein